MISHSSEAVPLYSQNQTQDSIFAPSNRFIWGVLAFQGGYLNVGGLLTVHIFVSHISGFAAHFGNSLHQGQLLAALYFSLVPLFFLIGSFVSSLFTELRRDNNLQPIYIYVMLLMSVIFAFIAAAGMTGRFGIFGEPFGNFRDFILLGLLSFSCGTQNALFTNYSNSIIRTTHLTGIVTDLGIGLAKQIMRKDSQASRLNKVRLEIVFGFSLGSIVGAFIFPELRFASFLLPALISLLVGIRLYVTNKQLVAVK